MLIEKKNICRFYLSVSLVLSLSLCRLVDGHHQNAKKERKTEKKEKRKISRCFILASVSYTHSSTSFLYCSM